jgi:multidrug resistance protein, MATE family
LSQPTPIRKLLHMGVPRALSLLGSVLMGAVDVAMVSPLGKLPLSAMAMATTYVGLIRMLGGNVLQPADVLIAQANGRSDDETIVRVHHTSNQLSLLIAFVVVLASLFPTTGLRALLGGSEPELVSAAAEYCRLLAWSAPPLLLAYSLRLYVDGMKRPWPGTIIVLVANVINAVFNWLLIYGRCGLPALGVDGSAWATNIASFATLAGTLGYILWRKDLRVRVNYRRAFEWSGDRMRQLVALGLPQGLLIGFRNLYYAILAAITARIGAAELAGSQIAFSLFRLSNTPQQGFSWGVAVVVATEHGRKAYAEARRLLHSTYRITVSAALVVAVVFVAFAGPIARQYTSDPAIIDAMVPLLQLFAAFHIASALGFVGWAGLGAALDNRYATTTSILFQFLLGVPSAWLLGLTFGGGVTLVWIGPLASEFLIALLYYVRFRRLTRLAAA